MKTATIKTAYVAGLLSALAAVVLIGTTARAISEASEEPTPEPVTVSEAWEAPEPEEDPEPAEETEAQEEPEETEPEEAPQELEAAPEDPEPAPAEIITEEAQEAPEQTETAEEPQEVEEEEPEEIPAPALDIWDRPNPYPATLQIISTEPGPGDVWTVTAQHANGNIFVWFAWDAADLFPGYLVSVLMDDGGTWEIYDDAVIYYQYAGF